MNRLDIETKVFSFHQLIAGNCNQLEKWLDQLLTVASSSSEDLNLLVLNVNRKGKFVVVQSKLTWVSDHFTYYTSKSHGDWIIIEFEHFFKYNSELLKTYSSNTTQNSVDNSTQNSLHDSSL